MGRLMLLAAFLAWPGAVFAARSDAEDAAESVAATVLTLEGPAELEAAGRWSALDLGQLLGPGDRVRTGTEGRLHLALADGSTVTLAPHSELSLEALGAGGEQSQTKLGLALGLLHALVDKLGGGSRFEVLTSNAVAGVKGTDFEVQAGPEETVVAVNTGIVELGDSQRRRFEPVLPLHRRRLQHGRLLAAERLAKRDAGALRERWARARVFHAQRAELLRHFKVQDKLKRAKWRKELLKRRELREQARDRRKARREQR